MDPAGQQVTGTAGVIARPPLLDRPSSIFWTCTPERSAVPSPRRVRSCPSMAWRRRPPRRLERSLSSSMNWRRGDVRRRFVRLTQSKAEQSKHAESQPQMEPGRLGVLGRKAQAPPGHRRPQNWVVSDDALRFSCKSTASDIRPQGSAFASLISIQ